MEACVGALNADSSKFSQLGLFEDMRLWTGAQHAHLFKNSYSASITACDEISPTHFSSFSSR